MPANRSIIGSPSVEQAAPFTSPTLLKTDARILGKTRKIYGDVLHLEATLINVAVFSNG